MHMQTFKKRLEKEICHFYSCHPLGALLSIFIIPPIGILLAVAFFTALFAFPLSCFLDGGFMLS